MILSHSLRTASVKGVQLIDTNGGTNVTSISVPTHINGDMLIFVNGDRTATPPATTSGFTSLGTVASAVGVLQAIGLQGFNTRISDGTITTLTTPYYGIVFVLRNTTGIGQTAFVNDTVGNTVTSMPLPAISGLNTKGTSLLLAGTFFVGASAVTSPYRLTTPAIGSGRAGVFVPNNISSSYAAATLTIFVSSRPMTWQVEVL